MEKIETVSGRWKGVRIDANEYLERGLVSIFPNTNTCLLQLRNPTLDVIEANIRGWGKYTHILRDCVKRYFLAVKY